VFIRVSPCPISLAGLRQSFARQLLCQNNKSQPPPDLREDRPSPQCLMLSPPSLPAGRDVGNDDEVLASTYNVIIPHKESNVNIRFGSNRFIAALADVFGLDDAAPKCAGRVQGALTLTSRRARGFSCSMGKSRSM